MEATAGARQPAWFNWLDPLIGGVGIWFGSRELRARSGEAGDGLGLYRRVVEKSCWYRLMGITEDCRTRTATASDVKGRGQLAAYGESTHRASARLKLLSRGTFPPRFTTVSAASYSLLFYAMRADQAHADAQGHSENHPSRDV